MFTKSMKSKESNSFDVSDFALLSVSTSEVFAELELIAPSCAISLRAILFQSYDSALHVVLGEVNGKCSCRIVT